MIDETGIIDLTEYMQDSDEYWKNVYIHNLEKYITWLHQNLTKDMILDLQSIYLKETNNRIPSGFKL